MNRYDWLVRLTDHPRETSSTLLRVRGRSLARAPYEFVFGSHAKTWTFFSRIGHRTIAIRLNEGLGAQYRNHP